MGYVVVFGGCSWDSTFKQREDLSYSSTPDIGLPGGKGANQAVAIARAGYEVKMISMIGDDEVGQEIIKNLNDNKIDTSCVEVLNGKKSDGAQIYVSLTGENNMKRSREAIDEFNTNLIYDNADIIKNAEYVVTQAKVPRPVLEELINFCYENNVKTVLTPCPANGYEFDKKQNKELLEKITIITANEEEVLKIMGTTDFSVCIDKLPQLVATAGPKGVAFCDEEGFYRAVPAMDPKELKDTTGAGDTFCGNFVVALLEGLSKSQAVRRGIWAATLKLEHFGAQPGMPTKEQLLNRAKEDK